jgi:hypothetical protein
MRMLLIGLAFGLAAQAAAGGDNSFQPGGAPGVHPELYSFADVYRLTVGGPVTGPLTIDAAPEAPVRVAVAQAQPAEPRFTVTPLPQPDRWLLIVAGLALAGWVAHRRLVHSL